MNAVNRKLPTVVVASVERQTYFIVSPIVDGYGTA